MLSIHTIITNVRQALIQTFTEVDGWFDTPAELLAYVPETGGWRIEQILEHISLTNHFLLILIDKGRIRVLKSADEERLREALAGYVFNSLALDEVGKPGSFDWMRPDHMEPTGKIALAEVRATLHQQHRSCLDTLEALPNGEGVLSKTTMTVNNLGKLDVYQYLYFLAQHARRHLTQMSRVRELHERMADTDG